MDLRPNVSKQNFETASTLRYYDKEGLFPNMERMNRVLDMLNYKCWHYEQAIADGNEDRLKSMKPEDMPEDIREAYLISRQSP